MYVEVTNFWSAASEHAAACRRFGAQHPQASAAREELEAIALNTEWPRLRAACQWTIENPQAANGRVASRRASS
jgi:hypothetical protein